MHFYCAPVPTYYGGFMTFAWGTDNLYARNKSVEEIAANFKQLGINTRYYNPEIHQASFALPQYIKNAFSQVDA